MQQRSPLWFVLMALILTPGTATAAAADPQVPNTAVAHAQTLNILNRLSFGPRPGDVQRVESMGIEAYIQQQLAPESIPEAAIVDQPTQTPPVPPRLRNSRKNRINGPATAADPPPQAPRKAQQQRARQQLRQAAQARLSRAIASPRQLQEVMVDFWFNHFNVFAGKPQTRPWIASYEQQAIRPHALGRFRDLLGATAKHPAMLYYLDNWQNTAPNSPIGQTRAKGLNENYARELMELHTLGVDGGYTQTDVITLAKILTGWGVRRHLASATPDADPASATADFYFDPRRHDASDKVFLGQPIASGGITEGEQALDILARSPATAHHISYELAQYFVADAPPPALVDRLSQTFRTTDGDIRAVLNTLFHSPEFQDPRYFNAKFKTPYQYVVSTFRATGLGTQPDQFAALPALPGLLQQLGMPLYGCPTPNGYANTEVAWLSPDAIARRLNFATALASGKFPPAPALATPNRDRQINPDPLALTLGQPFSPKTQQAIAQSPPELRAALILGSPEFMRK